MPLVALENGVPWNWTSFGEYLEPARGQPRGQRRLPGRPLRPAALGDGCASGAPRWRPTRRSPPCRRCWPSRSRPAGWASRPPSPAPTPTGTATRSPRAMPTAARCSPSARWWRDHPGTTLEYITNGCLDTFSRRGDRPHGGHERPPPDRPLNWNLLTVDSRTPDKTSPPARSVVRPGRRGRWADRRSHHAHAGAHEHELPHPLRPVPHPRLGRRDGAARSSRAHRASWRDPAVRARLDEAAHSQGGRRVPAPLPLGQLRHRRHLRAGERGAALARRGRHRRRTAASRPFDALLDLVIADDLRTVLWPKASDGDDATWAGARRGLERPAVPWSAAPTPAPISTGCAARTTRPSFLGDCLRKRKLVPVERAVQMMTEAAGRALRAPRPRPRGRGMRGRPVRLRPGHRGLRTGHAWSTTCPVTRRGSTPAPTGWYGCWSTGWRPSSTVLRPARLPGTLLRSGRDTTSVVPTPA